jgi:hypothetical protein
MKYGILGSGIVGRTLGTALSEKGHEVMIGTRDPNKAELQEWKKKAGPWARAGTLEECAKFGEVLFLCTSWQGTESALQLCGPTNLNDKVVIDVTNPLDFSKGAPPRLALSGTTSGGEVVQEMLPRSHVVKAFNIITAKFMVDGRFAEGKAEMFFAGNNPEAKKKVESLIEGFNWTPVDLGNIEGSRILESFAMLWILYGFKTNAWNHAFKLVRK